MIVEALGELLFAAMISFVLGFWYSDLDTKTQKAVSALKTIQVWLGMSNAMSKKTLFEQMLSAWVKMSHPLVLNNNPAVKTAMASRLVVIIYPIRYRV